MSAARDRWLEEGVAVLASEGAAGVRIDHLAARLRLSKGSFHHHFDGAEGFKRDLLARVQTMMTGALDDAVAALGPRADTRETLSHLVSLLGTSDDPRRPGLETALRAWAATDQDAAATQAAVDVARLGALTAIWRPATGSDEEARLAALLPYLLAVGASVLVPPVPPADLNRLYELLLRLVPPPTAAS